MNSIIKKKKSQSTESKLVRFSKEHVNKNINASIKLNAAKMSVSSGAGGALSNISCVSSNSETSNSMCWDVEKPRKWDPWEDGEFGVPHGTEPNEVNFLGGLGPNVGHPRTTLEPKRPTAVQKIYNMRTRNQPVFTFCENPKKANNVVRKKEKCDHTNIKLIATTVDRIRLCQNIETPPPSEFSEDPTEVCYLI